MSLFDFVKAIKKSALLVHLKNIDPKTFKWRKDLLDAVVTKEELEEWMQQGGVDHGSLTGLADDDHTQYILASGSRALTGNWDAGSFEIRAQTLESDVATGTAPLTIASTTKVTNLNVDKLDDQEGSYYLDSANFTGTEWDDLTDGGATTLHKHDHGNMDGLADDDHPQYPKKRGWNSGYSSSVAITFDAGTRTFSIAPTGANFEYWVSGVKYTKTTAQTVIIDDTEGLWFIYFDGATLTASQTPWSIESSNFALVATLYWDATNNALVHCEYELHSWVMDPSSHNYLHDVFGTRWEDGLAVSINGANLDVTNGHIHDEDIDIYITDDVGSGMWDQTLTPASMPILYRTGADGDWRILAASTTPVYLSSNIPQVNVYSGGSWIWQDVGVNQYFVYWVIASGDITYPVWLVPGQESSDSLANTRDGNQLADMLFGDLPSPEHKVIARVIIRRAAGSPYYTLTEVNDYRQAVDEPSSSAPVVGDHGALTGLGDDDHPQYLLANGTRALSGDWDAGSYEIRAQTFESDVATGTAPFTIASTTVNTNLNADLLDGDHTSEFFHNNESNEIASLTVKDTPVGDDVILIEDADASWAKKYATLEDIPFGITTGGGAELDIDFEEDEGYTPGDNLSVSGFWRASGATGQLTVENKTYPGGAIEGCAFSNSTTMKRDMYDDATWTSGVVDIYCNMSGKFNQMCGVWLGDSGPTADGLYFGMVTDSGGDTTGFAYWSYGTPETYHSHFGTTNSTTAYWVRGYVDLDRGLGKMKGWSGAIEDEPGPWNVERTFTGAFPDPCYLGLHLSGTSTSSPTFHVWKLILYNNYVTNSTVGSPDHGLLGGLTDDDHSQYILADGSRALSANWDAGNYEIRSSTFESDVATGTAPLTIASTTKVTNLNADQVDGKDETAFVLVDGSRVLTANWDAGNYEIRSSTFESDVATGTAPFTIASTTVSTNLNADLVDGIHGTALLPLTAGSTKALTGSLYIDEALGIYFERSGAEGVYVGVLNADASDNLTLGNHNHHTIIDSTDTIECDNTLRCDTHVWNSFVNATKSKALADNVGANFFTWTPTTEGDHATYSIVYSIYLKYTISSVAKYFQQGGTYQGMMYYNGSTVDTTEINHTYQTVNTGVGAITVTLSPGADGAPPKGPSYVVDLTTPLGTAWVSGEISYHVIFTDVDHRTIGSF